jgi:cytidylate kinase
MSVITISREFGSEGGYIAEKAAQTLGYHLVDKTTMENVLVQYGFVEFDKHYDAALGFWTRFAQRTTEMVDMLNRVIRALARHGNVVIVGRGSFALLHGLADVINVRLQAPLPLRVERVMTKHNITDREQAEAIVIENDRLRTKFIESYYDLHWDSASAFDLVIDTGKVSLDLAAAWLVDAVKALPRKDFGDARTTRALEEDSILEATVADVLKCQTIHH